MSGVNVSRSVAGMSTRARAHGVTSHAVRWTTAVHVSRWTAAAYMYGLLVTAVLGYFLAGLVIQVSDSFGNLLAVQGQSLGDVVSGQFSQQAYLRPLLWAQIKIAYEMAGGAYFLWFRAIQIAQVGVLIALCIRVLKPTSATDAALVPLSLAVLVGMHTFVPLLREAFPINSFLTIAICCVAAAALSFRARPGAPWDALAVALFIGSVLTVESGLLVWVICVSAYVLGARGISRPALVAMTMSVVGYMVLRMALLDVGAPSLAERASGFGFSTLEPGQLQQQFGDRPWFFYAYNIVSSVSTVLFSEPKGGIWRFTWELTTGQTHPWTLVSVLSSVAATSLLVWLVWVRRTRIRAWSFDEGDRIVGVFVAVLVANAVISFPYTKNVIMSPAGVFFALAVYVAARAWLQETDHRRLPVTLAVVTLLACGWAYRVAGTHYNLRWTAAGQRAEWVSVDAWLARQRIALRDADARALRDALRKDALWNHPTPFQPSPRWQAWFDIDW